MSWPKCPRKPRKKQLNLNYLVQLARQMKIFENRENTLTKVCEETLLKHTSALNKHAVHKGWGRLKVKMEMETWATQKGSRAVKTLLETETWAKPPRRPATSEPALDAK